MEIKKYVIKCHKCNKDLVLDVKISKMGHLTFIDDMTVAKGSCHCLKNGSSIKDLAILFKQLLWINDNKDIIVKDLEKQD